MLSFRQAQNSLPAARNVMITSWWLNVALATCTQQSLHSLDNFCEHNKSTDHGYHR